MQCLCCTWAGQAGNLPHCNAPSMRTNANKTCYHLEGGFAGRLVANVVLPSRSHRSQLPSAQQGAPCLEAAYCRGVALIDACGGSGRWRGLLSCTQDSRTRMAQLCRGATCHRRLDSACRHAERPEALYSLPSWPKAAALKGAPDRWLARSTLLVNNFSSLLHSQAQQHTCGLHPSE